MIVAVADTHALVWALFDDNRLSARARAALNVAGSDQVAVSAISLAEIVYLEEKNRIPNGTFARVASLIAMPSSSLIEVPVSAAIVEAMIRVPRDDVPDLPDRLIAATALHLGVPAVSRDAKIRASGLDTIW